VYEWHEGTVSLISSGEDAHPSFFLGWSPYVDPKGVKVEGGNVFIGTHANLIPSQATESQGNIYDARICEPEDDPCIQPPAGETAQCEGDACQNPPAAPIEATPGSSTFFGAGNLLPSVTPSASKRAAPTKTAAQIRAEKLARALKACRKKPKLKRAECERQARKRYAPAKKRGKR